MSDWIKWLAPPAIVFAGTGSCLAVEYLTLEHAQKLMFPDATFFESAQVTLTPEQARTVEKRTGVRMHSLELRVWRATAEDKIIGYFVLDDVVGKHELINFVLALDPKGTVRQLEVLNYREAYGYEIRNPAWRKQFVGKVLTDPVRLDEDIRNISGATLSCRHVTDGVRRTLGIFDVAIK